MHREYYIISGLHVEPKPLNPNVICICQQILARNSKVFWVMSSNLIYGHLFISCNAPDKKKNIHCNHFGTGILWLCLAANLLIHSFAH